MKKIAYLFFSLAIILACCGAATAADAGYTKISSITVSPTNNNGIIFTAPSDGDYQFKITGGAASAWPSWTQSNPGYTGYTSYAYMYLNRYNSWSGQTSPYGERTPSSPSYIIGWNNGWTNDYSAAEAAGKSSVPIHLYLNQGDFIQFLFGDAETAYSDNRGAGVTIEISKATSNNLPVANAGPDQTVFINMVDEVRLDGTLSKDEDNIPEGTDPITYNWKLISGPDTPIINNPTTTTPTFKPTSTGNYTFELTVTDSHGAKTSDTVVIQVVGPNNEGNGIDNKPIPGDAMNNNPDYMDKFSFGVPPGWIGPGGLIRIPPGLLKIK